MSIKYKAKHVRSNLIRKYGKCIVTGWKNPLEYQAAHIVPRHVGYALNYHRVNNDENCILLTNSLHALFDDMIWTFNLATGEPVDDASFTTKLLIRPNFPIQDSILGIYHNSRITVPSVYIPSMYLHYSVYKEMLNWNNNTKSMSITDIYRKHINSKSYRELSELSGSRQFLNFIQKKSE